MQTQLMFSNISRDEIKSIINGCRLDPDLNNLNKDEVLVIKNIHLIAEKFLKPSLQEEHDLIQEGFNEGWKMCKEEYSSQYD